MLKLIFAFTMIVFSTVGGSTFEKSLVRIINDTGHDVEVHKVYTEDKYILTIFRLPSKLPNPKIALLMHGLESSANDYVTGGNDASLAYLLADNDFDVWLGNGRGNIFSQNHETFDKTSLDFWNFSFHEIGMYDLPAIIDYALDTVNGTSLAYVGHSQGTTELLVLLSMKPEYNSKISTAHLMGPVAYLRYPPLFAKLMSLIMYQLEDLVHLFRNFELHPPSQFYCDKNSFLRFVLCKYDYILFGGDSSMQYSEFTPSSIGYKELLHYGQIIQQNGKFLQFDYQKGIHSDPPPYNLSNIKAKIHFLYGTHDFLVNPKDAHFLMAKLKRTTIGITKLNNWNHLDFLFHKEVNEKVNNIIYNKMKLYM